MNSYLITAAEFQTRSARTSLAVIALFALGGLFWMTTAPVTAARVITPNEMIEAGLPPGLALKTAGRPQFLTAVCAAVKSHRQSAAVIAKTAVTAHHEYASEIVATAVRCARGDNADCEVTGAIVAASISAWPQAAAAIDDAAVAAAPDCVDPVQKRTESDGKQVLDGKEVLSADIPAEGPENLPDLPTNQIGSVDVVGGGGFNPQESRVWLCDNGQQRKIRWTQMPKYLTTHPGAHAGKCQVTPATSR